MMNTETIYYYYLRENNPQDTFTKVGKPYGVVAFRANEDGTVNRGITVCSRKDVFKKSVGRKIAVSRLLKAEADCKSSNTWGGFFGSISNCPVDLYVQPGTIACLFIQSFPYKSMFHGELTFIEQQILLKHQK